MPYWIFTEDEKGRYGCLGCKESQVAADALANDYMGITYVKDYDTYDRGEAKRYFRGWKSKGNLDEGYKNVRNLAAVDSFD